MLRALLFAASSRPRRPAPARSTSGSSPSARARSAAATSPRPTPSATSVNRAHRGVLRCSPEATPGIALQPRSAARPPARLRAGAVRLAEGSLCRQRNLRRHRPDDRPAQRDVALSRGAHHPRPPRIRHRARSPTSTASASTSAPPPPAAAPPVASILEAIDLPEPTSPRCLELPTGSSIDELCAGRIDASILIVGHPNAAVARALQDCGAILVPVAGAAASTRSSRSIRNTCRSSIPQSTYPELTPDVPTYAVIATVVTRADIAPDLVEALVAATLADLREIAIRAPVLAGLDPAAMRARGLSAPLHPGALAAFDAFASGSPRSHELTRAWQARRAALA